MKKKLLLIIAVVVLVIIIIVLNVRSAPRGEEVETEIVKKGEIVSKVSADGELRAKAQVDISAETIGRVKKVYYKEGDRVNKGSLIIELDDLQANASWKLAEAQLKQSEQALDRSKNLFDKGLISKESFEQVQLSFESAKARYDQAYDAYKKTNIYAPISGKIMKINIEEGETAMMGTMNYQGTVLATIADMSMMTAVVKIDETDVPQVKNGQKAEITADALSDSVFKGTVAKVGLMPTTDQLTTDQTTDFEVEIDMKDFSPTLRPGMNVKAEIVTSQKTDVLVVPIQAVGKRKIKDKPVQSVFVVNKGKAVLKEVVTGTSSDVSMEIVSGVSEGDTVIVGPFRVLTKLKDGGRVRIKQAGEEGKDVRKPAGAMRFLRRATRT